MKKRRLPSAEASNISASPPVSARRAIGRTMRALWPAFGWAFALTVPLLCIELVGVLQGRQRSFWDWLGFVAMDLGFVLPFTTFAAGIRHHCVPRRTSRGAAIGAGIVAGSTTYFLWALAGPLAEHAAVAREDRIDAASSPFGADTPAGILRNIRYVEANPPEDGNYSLSIDQPERAPPEWLRLLLHMPIVLAVFAVINTVIGLLIAQLTSGLPPPVRRNARLGAAVAGGVAFFAVVASAGSYARDWTETSGVLAAWGPLALPLAEAFALWAWVRVRSHGSPPTGEPIG